MMRGNGQSECKCLHIEIGKAHAQDNVVSNQDEIQENVLILTLATTGRFNHAKTPCK